jgi:hypothetical protein|tara:strand:+ start:396 stop:560 length:165 start_codon:yes stop_codon:yes gene_type:complete
MKHFTKTNDNEVIEFNAKFKNTKKSYVITTNGVNILSAKTDDAEIITWLKAHGF